jgi:hypothetical protein
MDATDIELEKYARQRMLDVLFTDWVQVKIETGHDPHLLTRDTFLRVTGLSRPDEPPKNKLQQACREAYEEGVRVLLFVDWANTELAKGRDERELLFETFAAETRGIGRNLSDGPAKQNTSEVSAERHWSGAGLGFHGEHT